MGGKNWLDGFLGFESRVVATKGTRWESSLKRHQVVQRVYKERWWVSPTHRTRRSVYWQDHARAFLLTMISLEFQSTCLALRLPAIKKDSVTKMQVVKFDLIRGREGVK